jgi:hypothetical protein
MSNKIRLPLGALLLSFTALAAPMDSLSLFVGYADNLRASGFFP